MHSERPKLYAIMSFLGVIGLNGRVMFGTGPGNHFADTLPDFKCNLTIVLKFFAGVLNRLISIFLFARLQIYKDNH